MEAAKTQGKETTPIENSTGLEEVDHQEPSPVTTDPVTLGEVPGEPESNPEETRTAPTLKIPSELCPTLPEAGPNY